MLHLRPQLYLVAVGADIGARPAESGANHVLHQRMNRTGTRWDRPGGEAVAALMSAYRSTGCMAAVKKRSLLLQAA